DVVAWTAIVLPDESMPVAAVAQRPDFSLVADDSVRLADASREIVFLRVQPGKFLGRLIIIKRLRDDQFLAHGLLHMWVVGELLRGNYSAPSPARLTPILEIALRLLPGGSWLVSLTYAFTAVAFARRSSNSNLPVSRTKLIKISGSLREAVYLVER